jgi:hypothetical protein
MASQGGSNNGNGQPEGDVIVWLHSAVKGLQGSMVRHPSESQDGLAQIHETISRFQETLSRHYREKMEVINRIAETLKDLERRLAVMEAKPS